MKRHDSDEFLRLALDAARMGTWSWNVETGHVMWSPQVEQILGFEPGAFEGTYEAYRQLQHPDDLARVERTIAEAIRTDSDYEIEHRVRRADGTVRWLRGRGRAYFDDSGKAVRMAGTVTDITEPKLASEHARRVQFSIDHAADAVFWCGADAGLLYVNDRACRSLGYSREELLSLSVHDVDPKVPRDTWRERWNNLRAEKAIIRESVHRRKDGTTFPVELNLSYFEYEGESFVSVFARDLSERVQAEAERQRLEAKVRHTQKLESLGILAGGIAHDFNNLLVGILGSASLGLSELPQSSPVRARFESIQAASTRAADLARQMLAYSGKGRFHVEPTDLSALAREMCHLLESSISKKANLQLDFADALPNVHVDVTQLQQVVMNLITNASDALGDESGTIRLSTGMVDAGTRYFHDAYINDDLPAGRYCYLEVSDDGRGIEPDELGKIFDPFFTTKFTGRGLGLAAVLGIVRAHGGAIKLESESGKGTVFRVLLPSLDSQPINAASTGADTDAVSVYRGVGTILVVDDEELVRDVASHMLERHGFGVLTAADGQEAIEIYTRRADEIRAVLLDMTMPKMNGAEACRELRRIRPDATVIVSSGFNEQDTAERFRGDPPAAFVQKPYRTESLIRAVRNVLDA